MPVSPINRTMNAREWGYLLLLALIWGCTFFFVALALRGFPALTLVLVRVAIAAAILLVVIAIAGIPLPREPRAWIAFAQMSILNNVIPFTLINWGQTRIASGVASILIATTPLFTSVVAHFATSDEKMTPQRVVGVAVGFVGVAIMIGGSFWGALGNDLAGELALLGAAVAYALSSVFARRFNVMGVAPLASATGLLTASTFLMLPLVLIFDQPWMLPAPGLDAVLAVLGLAVLGTAVGYMIYFRLAATAGATNLMLVTFLMPVTAILLGVAVLSEQLEQRHIVGMALIAFGLAAIDGRIWRWLRRAQAIAPAE